MHRFGGRVALVTGAAGGIGSAVARRLAVEGASVALFDRDQDGTEAVAEAIAMPGGGALILTGDTAVESSVAAAVAATIARFGRLDLLACVAGMATGERIVDAEEEEWNRILAVNLGGAMLFSKHALPFLRQGDGGAVVYVSSVVAFAGAERSGAYAAAKAGLVSLARVVACEHAGDGIRANCVAPGPVLTPALLRDARVADPADPGAELRRLGESLPLGRLIEAEEVASMVVYLLSDEARAVNGSCHLVDGGMLARLPG